MKPLLIGLTGRAHSGKSTAAEHLNRNGFIRMSFAGPLKQMMLALGLNERQVYGDLKETPCELLGGKTPRFALQTIGTEWGRRLIDENLWVNVAMFHVREAFAEIDARPDLAGRVRGVVFDDCRFPNEVAAIKEAGGVIFRIERAVPGIGNAHESEQHIESLPCDAVVENEGSIERLYCQMEFLAATYCGDMRITHAA